MNDNQLDIMKGIMTIIVGQVVKSASKHHPVQIEEIGLYNEIEEFMGPELFCECIDVLEKSFNVRFELDSEFTTIINMFLTVCNSPDFNKILSTNIIDEFLNNVELGSNKNSNETTETVEEYLPLVTETVGIVDVYTNDTQDEIMWECCEFYGICQDYDPETNNQFPVAIVKDSSGSLRSVFVGCVKFKLPH